MSSSTGSAKVFVWFQNLATITTLFNWITISFAYIKFHSALRAQGISRNSLVFKSRFQPYTAWFSLVFFSLILFFNGFYTFPSKTKVFDKNDFITAYVGVPIYLGLFMCWKFLKKTKWIKSKDADITTGKAALDAADAHWPERRARNVWERIWFFIA